jgi:hydroxylamine reductase
MEMFCRQCEQTAGGKGCTIQGVCGKSPEVATLQDLLLFALKGIGFFGYPASRSGWRNPEVDRFVMEGLFSTVTNVNFDADRLEALLRKAGEVLKSVRQVFMESHKTQGGPAHPVTLPSAATWIPAATRQGLIEQGAVVGLLSEPEIADDIRSLREIILFGLKGMAAYADHAHILGQNDDTVNAFFYKGLAALTDKSKSADELVALAMELGQTNYRTMEILNQGHIRHFGAPQPTPVPTGVKKGPAIAVSGHDLEDLEELLKQTEGKGFTIYTHGEMLPAHGYPGLKKYPHFYGHYGTAWQNQQKEFAEFPGAVLMTTNCIQRPRESYQGRLFTTGLVAFPGIVHISTGRDGKKDFGPLIEAALSAGGFPGDKPDREILVGFGHDAVLGVADKVIEAVKSGQIKHFFLIGGCDGAKPGRNYYTEFAQKTPPDTMILTLACGKFRFNRLDFGTVAGLPRLLDVGQCNDSYSAVRIASALAEAFGVGVNDLPLSIILSWYEQKAVVVLLTLLSLGIQNIKLGPSLPAFITPGVLQVLVDKFHISPITTPEADLVAGLEK